MSWLEDKIKGRESSDNAGWLRAQLEVIALELAAAEKRAEEAEERFRVCFTEAEAKHFATTHILCRQARKTVKEFNAQLTVSGDALGLSLLALRECVESYDKSMSFVPSENEKALGRINALLINYESRLRESEAREAVLAKTITITKNTLPHVGGNPASINSILQILSDAKISARSAAVLAVLDAARKIATDLKPCKTENCGHDWCTFGRAIRKYKEV